MFLQSTSPNRKLEVVVVCRQQRPLALTRPQEGQECCCHGQGDGDGDGDDDDAVRQDIEEKWAELAEGVRGVPYFERFPGPLSAAARQLPGLLGRMVTRIHAPFTEIEMWKDPDANGRSWDDPHMGDDLLPQWLGCTKVRVLLSPLCLVRSLPDGKFGGVPHLPPLLAHYGRRKDFVCQIDCSQLAPYDLNGLLPTQVGPGRSEWGGGPNALPGLAVGLAHARVRK